MPTLHWLSRDADLRQAQTVPFCLLEQVSVHGAQQQGNMLIQGDNLVALKALLPYFAGQVKCIYIDPPYNTRSAFEHYDDNLEHSQWLSLMYPRLELLRELLSNDGSIWVSCDDNESHYLKVIMDEIYGRKNFITTICWESRYSRSSDAVISLSHNFIHLYSKNINIWKTIRNRLPRTKEQEKQYKNPDNDPRGPWRAIPWDAPNIRPNLTYEIRTPKGSIKLPPQGRCWSRTEDQWLEIERNGLAYFGKNNDGAPSFKSYLSDAPLIVPNSWWEHEESGHTDEAKKEIVTLFQNDVFDTPKPERLLHRILHIATNPGDLVLDSFLGSGTTAAVAHKMGRRYIGIEIGDHAVTHCLPRLEKVIEGEQGGISQTVGWQGGGGFAFYRLGAPVFAPDGSIRPDITFPQLAAHIWFTETGTPLPQADDAPSPLLGVYGGTAIYLLYNGILKDKRPAAGNVLTRSQLSCLPEYNGPKIIYGSRNMLGANTLRELGIVFRQTPYDIKGRGHA